jgi:hypothetical protein
MLEIVIGCPIGLTDKCMIIDTEKNAKDIVVGRGLFAIIESKYSTAKSQ